MLASFESAKRLTKSNNALDTTITDSTQKLTNLLISLDATKYAAVYEEIEALHEEGMKKIQEANTPVRAEYQYSVYQNKIYTLLFACENGGQS